MRLEVLLEAQLCSWSVTTSDQFAYVWSIALIFFIFLLESLLYWVIPFFFFLQLMKEFPLMSVLNIHENLLEALLEMQAYSEVQVMK